MVEKALRKCQWVNQFQQPREEHGLSLEQASMPYWGKFLSSLYKVLDVITKNISVVLCFLLIYILKLDMEEKRKAVKKPQIFVEGPLDAEHFTCLSISSSQAPHEKC